METLTLLEMGFDAVLGIGLIVLAWQALTSPDLFKSIVFFISFGLLMVLAWVQLDAPDIALAEAAIGAGLTGALLLAAYARLPVVEDNTAKLAHENQNLGGMNALAIVASLLAAVGLAYSIWTLPQQASGLSVEVAVNLDKSGVQNDVTAVLLNFRAYDTLLETVVLLIALLGVWSLGGAAVNRKVIPGPVLDTLARLLVPILILVAAYLLWAGADAPGGAFQAGSVLASAGVLLLLADWRLRSDLLTLPLRLILVIGPATFVAMAIVLLLLEGQLLRYPQQFAGVLILVLEIMATVSIGATLLALFMGGAPRLNKDDI